MRALSNKDTAISSFVKELEERIKQYSIPILKEGYRDFNLCKSKRPLVYFTNEPLEARYPTIINKINKRENELYPIVVVSVDSSSKLDKQQTRLNFNTSVVLEGINGSGNIILKGKMVKTINAMQIAIFGRSRLIVNNISDTILMALFDKYIYHSDMIVYQNDKPIGRVPNQIALVILNRDDLEFSDATEQEKGIVITACDLEFSLPVLMLNNPAGSENNTIKTTSISYSNLDCII